MMIEENFAQTEISCVGTFCVLSWWCDD